LKEEFIPPDGEASPPDATVGAVNRLLLEVLLPPDWKVILSGQAIKNRYGACAAMSSTNNNPTINS